jgi:hypothetical protein
MPLQSEGSPNRYASAASWVGLPTNDLVKPGAMNAA